MNDHEEPGTDAVLRGASRIAAAVAATLDPSERKAILKSKQGGILITSNVRKIVYQAEFKNPFEDLGAQLMRQVVEKLDLASHGSCATGVVLAHAVLREGLKALNQGTRRAQLVRSVEAAVKRIGEELEKLARPIPDEMIGPVATLAADNDPDIGKLVAEAMQRVGKNGVITIGESKAAESHLKIVEGTRLNIGYLSPYFVTDPERMECVLDNPYILIHEKRIGSMRDLLPILEQIAKSGRPLLALAEDFDGEVLATLVVNKLRGSLNSVAVRFSGAGEGRRAMLEDMAILTGCKAVAEGAPTRLDAMKLDDLGQAKHVIVDKETTTIVDCHGHPKAIEYRISELRSEIEKSTGGRLSKVKLLFQGQTDLTAASNLQPPVDELQLRLHKLGNRVAVIMIGALTETEMHEKKILAREAVNVTQHVTQHGVVPGGGIALLRAGTALSRDSDDTEIGTAIVTKACEEPFRLIAECVGLEANVARTNAASASDVFYGLNAKAGEWQDLFDAGIVDSAKALRLALEVAAAESLLFLSGEIAAFEA